jgi:voltage-gated potassium channel Kch
VLVLSDDVDALRQLGVQGAAVRFGDPRQAAVLEAAGAHRAAAFVITGGSLPDKMRMCAAVREVSPHATLVAIANGKAEQAWLEELGANTTFDALGETADALLKRLRASL